MEIYAEPQTRVELIINELPGTILIKIDTDTNPNRQGGLFHIFAFHILLNTYLKPKQALTQT